MLKEWLDESNHTVVFTGAGMSTESGLPDFRSSSKGMYNQKNPSEIASTDALNNNVEAFIAFYRQRVESVKKYGPHKGHAILADWEAKGKVKSIITQNVDGFHERAGSKNVAELHGSLQTLRCKTCHRVYDSTEYINQSYYCSCGGVLRPSVVLFGETLPESDFSLALNESQQADLFIVLGSSLSVSPANQFPLIAKENGAKLAIINEEKTELDHYADKLIRGRKIGEILEELDHS